MGRQTRPLRRLRWKTLLEPRPLPPRHHSSCSPAGAFICWTRPRLETTAIVTTDPAAGKTELEGTWLAVAATVSGKAAPQIIGQHLRFKDNRFPDYQLGPGPLWRQASA